GRDSNPAASEPRQRLAVRTLTRPHGLSQGLPQWIAALDIEQLAVQCHYVNMSRQTILPAPELPPVTPKRTWMRSLHVIYPAAAVLLAIVAFFVGRSTGRNAEIKEIANNPDLLQAAKGVAALGDLKNTFAGFGGTSEWKAAQEAKKKGMAEASVTASNAEAVVTVEKVKRTRIKQREFGGEGALMKYDVVVIGYKYENKSQDQQFTIITSEGKDNFGNDLEDESDFDMQSALEAVGYTEYTHDRIGPGETGRKVQVFKKPLPNAQFYVFEASIFKGVGNDLKTLYLKAENK
ncbi:MAG TPA: hypothetical protein VGB55_02840, partial [Tepidisphaeraceae bacterium]